MFPISDKNYWNSVSTKRQMIFPLSIELIKWAPEAALQRNKTDQAETKSLLPGCTEDYNGGRVNGSYETEGLISILVFSELCLTLMFAVWRRGVRDVPHGVTKTLLHRNEKTWQKKATESDKTTSESLPRAFLRHLRFAAIWDRNLRADLPQHGQHGYRAFRPVPRRHLRPRDLQCALHNNLQSRWVFHAESH